MKYLWIHESKPMIDILMNSYQNFAYKAKETNKSPYQCATNIVTRTQLRVQMDST